MSDQGNQMKIGMRYDILDEITRRICAISQPERIILSGSYARSEPGPDSDIDVLVVIVQAPHLASPRWGEGSGARASCPPRCKRDACAPRDWGLPEQTA
jgi:hypothetical protein